MTNLPETLTSFNPNQNYHVERQSRRSTLAQDLIFEIGHPVNNQKFHSFKGFSYNNNIYIVSGYIGNHSNSNIQIQNPFSVKWDSYPINHNGKPYKFNQQPSFTLYEDKLYFMCGKGQTSVEVQ